MIDLDGLYQPPRIMQFSVAFYYFRVTVEPLYFLEPLLMPLPLCHVSELIA